MPSFLALNAPYVSQLTIEHGLLRFEAPVVFVADVAAFEALDHVLLAALPSLVTPLITLEAQLLATVKAQMVVHTAQYAAQLLFDVVGAVHLHVSHLQTIVAFECRIILVPVPLRFGIHQFVENFGLLLIVFASQAAILC